VRSSFSGNKTNLDAAVQGCRNTIEHREGVTLIVGIFKTADNRGRGADQARQLPLSPACIRKATIFRAT
jgi:hypothetical protein